MHCEDCLRLTVGTADENDRFIALFQEVTIELGITKKRDRNDVEI